MDCASAPARRVICDCTCRGDIALGPCAHRLDSPARHCDGEPSPLLMLRILLWSTSFFLLRLRFADSLCE